MQKMPQNSLEWSVKYTENSPYSYRPEQGLRFTGDESPDIANILLLRHNLHSQPSQQNTTQQGAALTCTALVSNGCRHGNEVEWCRGQVECDLLPRRRDSNRSCGTHGWNFDTAARLLRTQNLGRTTSSLILRHSRKVQNSQAPEPC